MKYIFYIFILFALPTTQASNIALDLPPDISMVVSKDSPYDSKYSNAVRYRASIRNSLGSESSQRILFERFAPGKYGASDQVLLKKEIVVSSLPRVKEFIAELAKTSIEATYGCCDIKDLIWKDYQVHFKV